MRSAWLLRVIAVGVVGYGAPAHAQVATSSGSSPVRTEITLRGTITSAIELEIFGATDAGTPTTITGSGTSGVVNFGTYNLAGALLNGRKYRVNGAGAGTYCTATLSTRIRIAGYPNGGANVDIQRAGPQGGAPDVPFANLYFSKIRPSARQVNMHGTWADRWTTHPPQNPEGSVGTVPASTYVPGAGNIDNLLLNTQWIDHQVAIWIPDASGPGPFSVTVTYTATLR